VQRELFGRGLPRVVVPIDLSKFSKRWVSDSIEQHPERAAWREVPTRSNHSSARYSRIRPYHGGRKSADF
jgi:hypothetical protein